MDCGCKSTLVVGRLYETVNQLNVGKSGRFTAIRFSAEPAQRGTHPVTAGSLWTSWPPTSSTITEEAPHVQSSVALRRRRCRSEQEHEAQAHEEDCEAASHIPSTLYALKRIRT